MHAWVGNFFLQYLFNTIFLTVFDITGFLSPVPAVVVALTVDKYKYIVGQFPPAICYSMNNDHFFFSNTLPLLVILAFSTVLLTIIFWKIHKVGNMINSN